MATGPSQSPQRDRSSGGRARCSDYCRAPVESEPPTSRRASMSTESGRTVWCKSVIRSVLIHNH